MEDYTNSSSTTIPDSNPLAMPPYAFLVPLIIYLLLAALLRHHRVRTTLESHPYTNRRSFASMTLEDAFQIQLSLGGLECPFTFVKALQFALFGTYGIPSISKLLVQTTEFTEPATASKRYTDTEVLINDFVQYHPKSPRAIEAVGRMNFVHSLYLKSGKISNDDMLYTLSLFALEPGRWIDRYEWRKLEDFERCAVGTFWKEIGDAMGIGSEKLKSGGEGGAGWVDGLQWLEEVEAWGEEYEQRCMVPHKDNWKTAEQTMELLLWGLPQALKPFGKKVVCVLMDDRLRRAMMYPTPPQLYLTLVPLVLALRKYAIRHFFFPRPYFLRVHNTTEEPSKDGNFFMNDFTAAPWYVKPTIWNRWGPLAWKARLMGLPLPGDEGDKYGPKGYKIRDVGPESMRGKGMDFMQGEKDRLQEMRKMACPFGRVKAE